MAAGEIVIVLVALFMVLLVGSVLLLLTGHQDSALAQSVLTWAGGTFFALLGVLGVKRMTDPGSVQPPGTTQASATITETPAAAPAPSPIPKTPDAADELDSMRRP